MLSRLIKKEILEHLMNLRFAIACVLCLIVVLCSLYVRSRSYAQVLDDYYQEAAMEKSYLDNEPDAWAVLYRGTTILGRPNPLKIFVRGMEDANGLATHVDAYGELRPISRAMQNTAVPLFPPIDLVAFVGLIMSLMALVFGYDAVCGEKQSGTLRLLLSYSVPRHHVLIAKLIGGYLTLIIPFLLTALAGAVIVLTQPNVALTSGQSARLMLVILLALLYIAVVYSLAVFVSCLTSRASTSIMVLLSVWVILVLAIPNLAPHVAQAWRPTAAAQEVQAAMSAANKQVWDREYNTKRDAYDKANGFGERWWETMNWRDWNAYAKAYQRGLDLLVFERTAIFIALNEYSKLSQNFRVRTDAQIELSRRIARISPFSCFALAATELADAGLLETKRQLAQLEVFQREWTTYGCDEVKGDTEWVIARKGKGEATWYDHRLKPIPVFQYVPPAAHEYAKAVAVDVGILAGMVIVFFMLAYLKFLRYDVR